MKMHLSKLRRVGRQAAREAMREKLLIELYLCSWHLTMVSERLEMGGSANVIRAIRELGLLDEYKKAQSKGLILHGGRHKRPVPKLRIVA